MVNRDTRFLSILHPGSRVNHQTDVFTCLPPTDRQGADQERENMGLQWEMCIFYPLKGASCAFIQ